MEIYPLNDQFQRLDLIEEFHSLIWTERWNEPGEVQLTVEATGNTIAQLAEGVKLSIPESDEVMLIETQSNEDGKLTVTGPSLLDFMRHRIIRPSQAPRETTWLLYETTPGSAMAQIVEEMCGGSLLAGAIGGHAAYEAIPGLAIGEIATGGDLVGHRPVEYTNVYDEIKKIADTYSLGITLRLNYATLAGFQLVFDSWDGLDRTRGNWANNDIVSFSPAMDTLADVKELRSVKGYKHVCYAFNVVEDVIDTTGHFAVAYADPSVAGNAGFNRRSMQILDTEFKSSDFETVPITIHDIVAVLHEKARDALANNNYTKVIDGEVVPQGDYIYGQHYRLGDIIELQGNTGAYQKARVKEYIRTQDASGTKAYPTVSVIE